MAYDKLKQRMLERAATAQVKSGVSLSTPLRGVGKLPAGSHVVRIDAVDLLWLDSRGYLTLSLSAGPDLSQRHKLYLWSREGQPNYSWGFRQFMRAVCTTSVHPLLMELFEGTPDERREGLELLRGLRVGVHVELGEGYTVEQTATQYIRYYNNTYTSFDTLADLVEDSQERGIPQATTSIKEFYSVGGTQHHNDSFIRTAYQTLRTLSVPTSGDSNI